MRTAAACLLLIAIGCRTAPTSVESDVSKADAGIPDLLKGQGPDIKVILESRPKPDWYLHFYGTRGWVYGEKTAEANKARQMLITLVPEESPMKDQLRAGDVILGVDGKPFDKHPVYQFREYSAPANRNDMGLSVIMWRNGWSEPRTVDLQPQGVQPDFTAGDTIDLTKNGVAHDWNLGPTGARGWIYGKDKTTQAARQIWITKVHPGSPAAGVLVKGDVITGIGDKPFDSDARIALGRAIAVAETRTGKGELKLLRWRSGNTETVTIKLDVLGSYSETTPWNCGKTNKILDNACGYLVRNVNADMSIPGKVRTLALMATGNPNYMPFVRDHINMIVEKTAASGDKPSESGLVAWSWSYTNLLLSEYYLLTKDEKALPAIRVYSNAIALGQGCSGTWGHGMAPADKFTGKPHGAVGGYGSMNQCSTICWMSLVLAKRCGVTNPEIETAITRAHEFNAYFIDMGTVTYGDNLTLPGKHDDNGKTSSAAVAFAASGDERGTRFCSRMTVASHDVREEGHTGNYWSLLWGCLGAARSGPAACSAFLKENMWFYDLERRHDGGFEYQGKAGMGNGIDPKSGRQRGMSEHTTPHWDTTGARVLMYCLPLKKLAITGRDVTTLELTAADVADTIEAARYPAELLDRIKKYDGRPVDELKKLLGNWSPVVRDRAARSLSKKDGDHVPALREMLRSSDRFARYGACSALMHTGAKARAAVDDLITLLESDDRKLQLYSIKALGTTGDMRSVEALFKMAGLSFANDRYDTVYRYIAEALFGNRGSLIAKTAEFKDRAALLAAAKRFLNSVTGHTRSVIGQNVAHTLSLEEVRTLWADIDKASNSTATTYNTAIQMAQLRLMAKYHVAEGIDRCVWYLTNMKGHGSQDRVPKVLDILIEYGAHAKRTIPELEKVAALFETKPPGFPPNLSMKKAGHVRDTIKALQATDEARAEDIKLISIDGGWK